MSDELDLRVYEDDIGEDYIIFALDERRRKSHTTLRIVLRPEQIGSMMSSPTEKLHSIRGVPVVERPDGLTARERSIQRALASFPQTRDEQVAEALAEES